MAHEDQLFSTSAAASLSVAPWCRPALLNLALIFDRTKVVLTVAVTTADLAASQAHLVPAHTMHTTIALGNDLHEHELHHF